MLWMEAFSTSATLVVESSNRLHECVSKGSEHNDRGKDGPRTGDRDVIGTVKKQGDEEEHGYEG